ncbi:MAG: PDZ domain-containing protein [Candidatus Kerfeldbacteria bacterium]|nr:PDZ domain-containing protein [Candidatus Kerfeldbacteria bacterium]
MKLEPVPTAPGRRPTTPPVTAPSHFWLLLSLVGVSFIVGFFGALLAKYYPVQWPLAQYILVSDSTTTPLVLVDQAEPSSHAQVLAAWQEQLTPTVVTIFAGNEQRLLPQTALSTGVIISADGWIVSWTQPIRWYTNFTVVVSDGRVLPSTAVVHDAYSDVTYIKITASQLPVVNFRASPPLLGDDVVLFTQSVHSGPRVEFSTIENVAFNDTSEFSTSQANVVYLVSSASRAEYRGGPVFDVDGNMVGLNMLDHRILPVADIASGVYDIFAQGAVQRHGVDITYQPLDRLVNSETGTYAHGAKLVQFNSVVAGLEVEDIILAVGDTKIDRQHDFSAVLAEYDAGDMVELQIVRAGKKQTVAVVLGL